MYRNNKLLRLARLAPHCMSCLKRNEGDVVACHANAARYGKGMGLKAHDWAVAFCCGKCHAMIDQSAAAREMKEAWWEGAHRATIGWLFEAGHLLVHEPGDPTWLDPKDHPAPSSAPTNPRKPASPKPRQNRSLPSRPMPSETRKLENGKRVWPQRPFPKREKPK